MQQSIRSLEQARDQFASANQGQTSSAQKQAEQALQQMEKKLNAMPQEPSPVDIFRGRYRNGLLSGLAEEGICGTMLG